MSLAQQLSEYISACFTGLWINSHEHDDALAEIAKLCREQNWKLAVWDIASGLQIPGQNSHRRRRRQRPAGRHPLDQRPGLAG